MEAQLIAEMVKLRERAADLEARPVQEANSESPPSTETLPAEIAKHKLSKTQGRSCPISE